MSGVRSGVGEARSARNRTRSALARGYPAPVTTDPSPVPAAGARAVRATLLVMAGAVLALGVLGIGLALMAGDSLDPWPGLTMMLVGQAAALPSLVLAATGHARARSGRDPGARRLRRVLRATPVGLAVALVVATAVWVWWDPGMWMPTLACALVAAQVGLLARLLSR